MPSERNCRPKAGVAVQTRIGDGMPPAWVAAASHAMTRTVIQHVLSRLHDIGITDIFGVAGDYAFPIEDVICADPRFRYVGDCNELNAAYAADGYARIRG